MKSKDIFIILPLALFFISNSIAQSACIGQNQKEKDYQKYCGPNTCFKENGVGAGMCEAIPSNNLAETPPQDAQNIPCQGADLTQYSNCSGTWTYPNGNKYVGTFKDGKRSGQGTNIYTDGAKYIGDFQEDTFNGQGSYTYASGAKYIGEFKDGKFNGEGVYFRTDRTVVLSDWYDNKNQGRYIEYRADKSIKRSGIFKEGNIITSQYIDPASFNRIEEARAAEEQRLQEVYAAADQKIKEVRAAEERKIWLTTPAGKQFTAAEEAKAKKEGAVAQNKNPRKEQLLCLAYSAKINDSTEDDYYLEQRKKGIYMYFAIILGPNRIKIVQFNPLTILYESITATNINYKWEDTISYEMNKSLGTILIGRSPWTKKLDSEMQKYGVPSSGEYIMKIIPSKDPRHIYFHCW